MQVAGSAKNAFTYQVLLAAKEALLNHPNPNIKDLPTLEALHHIRLMSGGPPLSGEMDVDGVGVQRWQTVIYAAGDGPTVALDFMYFILEHKLRRGMIASMPRLLLQMPCGGFQGPLQGPWQVNTVADANAMPRAFAALPPRGRRHVLAQLEHEGDIEESKYRFFLRGGLYPFRTRLDELQVPAAQLDLVDDHGAPKQEYIRIVEFAGLEEGEGLLTAILEQALLRLPVYFINATEEEDDAVADWILQQPGVVPGKRSL